MLTYICNNSRDTEKYGKPMWNKPIVRFISKTNNYHKNKGVIKIMIKVKNIHIKKMFNQDQENIDNLSSLNVEDTNIWLIKLNNLCIVGADILVIKVFFFRKSL